MRGGAAIALAGRISDHLVETTLTAVTAYGSFLLAEKFHFSGVLGLRAMSDLSSQSVSKRTSPTVAKPSRFY